MDEQTNKEEYTTPKEDSPEVDTKLNGGVSAEKYEVDHIGIALFAVLFFVIGMLYFSLISKTDEEVTVVSLETTEEIPTKPLKDYFEDIYLEGTAAFVWDVKNDKVLFALNEETQLPLASITKLMTVATADKFISYDDVILINENNLVEEGDSGLFAFEEWNAKDLIDFTLMVSSNDGANVLASAAGAAKIVRSGSQADSPHEVFIEEMNTLAQDIGLKQTYFLNETGLDPTTVTSGGYGSARDVALLLDYIVTSLPELVNSTVFPTKEITSLSNFIHTATNTNQSVGNIPGLIASKTGFTDLAGGNLVIALDAGINRPIVVSILGSSLDGRFEDVETLVEATLNQINQ